MSVNTGKLARDAQLTILQKRDRKMQNIRALSEHKWGITKHAFFQAYHFALRYHEFQDILKYKTSTMGSSNMDGLPRGNKIGNATQRLAMQRQQAAQNVELIERTAIEADSEIYKYILKSATEEGVTYKYLKSVMDIPCGKKMFYDRRRKFYYLLSKKL